MAQPDVLVINLLRHGAAQSIPLLERQSSSGAIPASSGAGPTTR